MIGQLSPMMFPNVAAIMGGGNPLADLFTDTNGVTLANHVMTSGGGWTQHAGTLAVQSNKAQSGTSGTAGFASASAGQSDRSAAIDITVPAAPYTASLCFRVSSDGNSSLRYILHHDGAAGYQALAEVGVM